MGEQKENRELKKYKWIRKNISIEIDSKPEMDVHVVNFYWFSRKIGTIEIDGIELEAMGYKN